LVRRRSFNLTSRARRRPVAGRERFLLSVESECDYECGAEASECRWVQFATASYEVFLGYVHDPVAVSEAWVLDTVAVCEFDLSRVSSAGSCYDHTVQTAQYRDCGLA
jgi:hypothetical protein